MRTHETTQDRPEAGTPPKPARKPDYDILILGAGSAGLLCGLTAARRGRKAVLIEQGSEAGRKLRAARGGRCNCTNMNAAPEHYLSRNPSFTTQALARYAPRDFLVLLRELGLSAREEDGGRVFCEQGPAALADALEKACRSAGCGFLLGHSIRSVTAPAAEGDPFRVETTPHGPNGAFTARRLVVALGSPAWPAFGGTDSVSALAERLNLPHVPARPALCPLILSGAEEALCRDLAGQSQDAAVSCEGVRFGGGIVFTHQGLSGPAALNASLVWRRGDPLLIDLAPAEDLAGRLRDPANAGRSAAATLADLAPRRLVEAVFEALPRQLAIPRGRTCAELSEQQIEALSAAAHAWHVLPEKTAGLARAEAARGGLDTIAFSPKDMHCRALPGLYAVGEALDVTGELGGFNLQWAWASGFSAGNAL